MSLFRRLRRCRLGQTTSEYMIVLAVLAIGVMAAFAFLSDEHGPLQHTEEQVAQSYSKGLVNDDHQTMHVQQ